MLIDKRLDWMNNSSELKRWNGLLLLPFSLLLQNSLCFFWFFIFWLMGYHLKGFESKKHTWRSWRWGRCHWRDWLLWGGRNRFGYCWRNQFGEDQWTIRDKFQIDNSEWTIQNSDHFELQIWFQKYLFMMSLLLLLLFLLLLYVWIVFLREKNTGKK